MRETCANPQLQQAMFAALASNPRGGQYTFSGFQERAFAHILRSYGQSGESGSIICAGTGSGKTKAFYVPAFLVVLLFAWHIGIGLPSVLAFLALLYRLQPQLSRIDNARVTLATHTPGIQELARLLAEEPRQATGAPGRKLTGITTGVEFRNVSFRYGDARDAALKRVSFSIPRGAVVAIVATGSRPGRRPSALANGSSTN